MAAGWRQKWRPGAAASAAAAAGDHWYLPGEGGELEVPADEGDDTTGSGAARRAAVAAAAAAGAAAAGAAGAAARPGTPTKPLLAATVREKQGTGSSLVVAGGEGSGPASGSGRGSRRGGRVETAAGERGG